MSILGFLWGNLGLVVLALIYLAAVAAAFFYGGRTLAIAVATVGVGHLLYRTGRKQERAAHNERAAKIEEEREDAYRKIDERGTTRSDAADRLRRNDY